MLDLFTTVQPAAPSTVVSPAAAQEHVQSIQSDVDKSLKALRVIKSKYADDKLVQSEIVKIENILANVKVHCGTCAEECVKADLASAKRMHCCVEMFHDLDEAHMKTSAVLKHLKLDALSELPPRPQSTERRPTDITCGLTQPLVPDASPDGGGRCVHLAAMFAGGFRFRRIRS